MSNEKGKKGRLAIQSTDAPGELVPYSAAVKAGGWVFVSGQVATDYKSGLAPEVCDPEAPFLADPQELQSRYLLRRLKATLDSAGVSIARDPVRIYQWFTSPWPTFEDFDSGDTTPRIPSTITPYLRTRDEFIDEPRPASTGVRVRELLVPNATVLVDIIAMEPQEGVEKVGYGVPEGEPSPLAGYAPAIEHGDWVFLAGMVGTDFQGDFLTTQHMGPPSSLGIDARVNPYMWYQLPIEKQTDYTLQRLDAIARGAGTSLDRCVKAEVYLGNPTDFPGMDRVWKEWFPDNPPARVVAPYILPGLEGVRIEIALKLLSGRSELKREAIETSDAPEAQGHQPQALRAGNFLFLSSQVPADSHGRLAKEVQGNPAFPYHFQPGKMQMRYLLENAAAICEAGGTSLSNVCRQVAFYDDFAWYASSMEEWTKHFPEDPPVVTSLRTGGPMLVPGGHILLDLTAYVPE